MLDLLLSRHEHARELDLAETEHVGDGNRELCAWNVEEHLLVAEEGEFLDVGL